MHLGNTWYAFALLVTSALYSASHFTDPELGQV
jgi:hypothetical protein